MVRAAIGAALLVAGVVGLLVFREPVGTYSVEITGSGATAGEIVDADCRDGVAVGPFAGDERAESECALAEDGEETVRVVKLAVAGIVAVIGLWLALLGLRRWSRDVRSRVAYRRMVRRHEVDARRDDRGVTPGR